MDGLIKEMASLTSFDDIDIIKDYGSDNGGIGGRLCPPSSMVDCCAMKPFKSSTLSATVDASLPLETSVGIVDETLLDCNCFANLNQVLLV